MMFDFWKEIVGYFKEKPYWQRVQPLFTLLTLYLIAVVLAYEFLAWQYHFSPPLFLYARSYIVKQITVVAIAVGSLAWVFGHTPRSGPRPVQGKWLPAMRRQAVRNGKKLVLAAAVLAVLIPIFRYLAPRPVSHIRVCFLDQPDFDEGAFVYLVYELNRLQKRWYFEVDFDIFNPNTLSSDQRKSLEGDDKVMRVARMLANDQPFIGITSSGLGEDHFWRNEGKLSVISTNEWNNYAPPSVYEFLAHSIIVQSILIHLNAHAGGLPPGAFRQSRVGYNDLFQFTPRRFAMKASIPAAHLSPAGEELLFNDFGAEYMKLCSDLLRLDWLHSQNVTGNLERIFQVKL
jgi:hypothetical protein